MKKPIKRKAAKASERLSEKDLWVIADATHKDCGWLASPHTIRAVIRAYRAFMRKRR